MSTEKLNKFLKALDAVQKDYTCGFCLELCKKPVTLSTCYHIICGDHFKNLKKCPTCDIPLSGCTIFTDDRLENCVNSARELGSIFENFRAKSVFHNSKAASSNDTSKKRIKNVLGVSDKENKNSPGSSRSKLKQQEIQSGNVNTTILSTATLKINKGIEKRNNKGETSLHIACRLAKVDSVIDLLKQGANTNTKDNAGWTPLHEAVQNGRLDLVQVLLQYNTLIDVPGQGNETPLHEAVRYNHKEIADELVRNGADVNSKNCKGETPMQLASDQMKKVLKEATNNITQTQGVNITYLSDLHTELDFDNIQVFCVSQFRTVHNKLKLLTKHHSNLHIEAKFSNKVTHLLVDEENGVCTSSLNVLQGIVSSLWIISAQWILKSTEETLESFKSYEVTGVGNISYQGPRNSRYNKYKQLPGIFNGCHIYLHNFHTKHEISKTIVLTKAILTKLITDAGGIVLRRVPNPELIPEEEKVVPYHAKKDGKLVNCSHYIVFKNMYEPMYNMSHFKALPIGWLIECIEKYELCEPW